MSWQHSLILDAVKQPWSKPILSFRDIWRFPSPTKYQECDLLRQSLISHTFTSALYVHHLRDSIYFMNNVSGRPSGSILFGDSCSVAVQDLALKHFCTIIFSGDQNETARYSLFRSIPCSTANIHWVFRRVHSWTDKVSILHVVLEYCGVSTKHEAWFHKTYIYRSTRRIPHQLQASSLLRSVKLPTISFRKTVSGGDARILFPSLITTTSSAIDKNMIVLFYLSGVM